MTIEGPHVVVLVEGDSDAVALNVVAGRLGWSPPDTGIQITPVGGITNFGTAIDALLLADRRVHVGGLYDAGQAGWLVGALRRRGWDVGHDRLDLERLGFFLCDVDLEDEMIRALGVPAVEAIIDAAGELGALRTLQRQPHQREQPADKQVRRFIGTKSGRKRRCAELFATHVELDRLPAPITGLLGWALATAQGDAP